MSEAVAALMEKQAHTWTPESHKVYIEEFERGLWSINRWFAQLATRKALAGDIGFSGRLVAVLAQLHGMLVLAQMFLGHPQPLRARGQCRQQISFGDGLG